LKIEDQASSKTNHANYYFLMVYATLGDCWRRFVYNRARFSTSKVRAWMGSEFLKIKGIPGEQVPEDQEHPRKTSA
jgi:hypothetical protein